MSGRQLGVAQSIPNLDGMIQSVETPIVATPSGTQANAKVLGLGFGVHVVSTVASGNDAIAMERLATGSGYMTWIYNNTASNSMQLFGQGTDTIDAVATATGVAIAAQRGRLLFDFAPGKWLSFYGA